MTEDHEHELRKWEAERKEYLECLKHYNNLQVKSFEATINFAISAIKYLIIINGGAAISCITLIGNAIRNSTESNSILVVELSQPMTYFLLGIFFATFAGMVAYLAQYFFSEVNSYNYPVEESEERSKYNETNGHIANRSQILGISLQILGIVSALASIILFVVGVCDSQSVLQGYITEIDNKLPLSGERTPSSPLVE